MRPPGEATVDAGRSMLTPRAPPEDRPGGDAQARDRGVAGARNVGEVGGGNHALSARGKLLRQAARGGRSRARSSRRRAASAACGDVHGRARRARPAAGKQSQALLALRAIDAQLAPVAQDRELVAVGAVGGEATLEVAREALLELGDELVLIGRPRARAVFEASPRRCRPSWAARSANGAASRATAPRDGRGSVSAWPASSRSQVESVSCDVRPERMRPSSALRWASTREYSRRLSARSGQKRPRPGRDGHGEAPAGLSEARAGPAGRRSAAVCPGHRADAPQAPRRSSSACRLRAPG